MMFDGKALSRRRSGAEQRRIQMVFQDPYSSLNPRLTVGGMLRELLKVHHIVPPAEADAYCRELLTMVGLGEDAMRAFPRQFSGGQRQRVAIARALVLRPDVLVADEPVSALDVSVQATILNLLRDLQHELGLTLLLISHNLAVVRHLCDRVAVMYLGRIVEIAPTEQLFADPRHPYTKGLLAAIPRLTASQMTGDGGPAVVGDPPSALRLPQGCRFRTRCPIAQPVCEAEDPMLTSVAGDGHTGGMSFRLRGLRGRPVRPASRCDTSCGKGGLAISTPVIMASERGEVGLDSRHGAAALRRQRDGRGRGRRPDRRGE